MAKVYDSRDNIYEPTRGRRIPILHNGPGHGLGPVTSTSTNSQLKLVCTKNGC